MQAYQAVVVRENHRDELICRLVPASDADHAHLRDAAAQALHEAIKLHCKVEVIAELPPDAKPFVDQRTWT